MVSTFPDGSPSDGGHPAISADGRYVAFESVAKLLPTDTDNVSDIYRKDLLTGSMSIAPGVESKFLPSMSADGQKIVYMASCAPGLFDIFPSNRSCGFRRDAYVWDVAAGTTLNLRANMGVVGASISKDGRWAALTSDWEGEEGAGDTDLLFVDTTTGAIKGSARSCCPGFTSPAMSFDGRFAILGADDSYFAGLYRYDRDADQNGVFDEYGKTAHIPVSFLPDQRFVSGSRPTISNDGNTIAFMAVDTGLKQVPGIYVRNVREGTTTLASRNMLGLPSPNPIAATSSLSGDGLFLGLSSPNPDIVPGDFNLGWDVFVRDLNEESNELVSTSYPDTEQENSYEVAGFPRPSVDWMEPSLSLDGRFIAFQSASVQGMITRRVWVRDRLGECLMSCIEDPMNDVRQTAENCDVVCAKDAMPWASRSTSVTWTYEYAARSIRLSWTARSSSLPITSYRIYRSIGDGPLSLLATVEGTVLGYSDFSCLVGKVCRYRVTAVSSVGEGASSMSPSVPGIQTQFSDNSTRQFRYEGTYVISPPFSQYGSTQCGHETSSLGVCFNYFGNNTKAYVSVRDDFVGSVGGWVMTVYRPGSGQLNVKERFCGPIRPLDIKDIRYIEVWIGADSPSFCFGDSVSKASRGTVTLTLAP